MARKVYKLKLNIFTMNRNSMYVAMTPITFLNSKYYLLNSIVGTNIKSKYTALPDPVLCSSFFVNCLTTKISRISDIITSELERSPLTFNAHKTSNPISCQFYCFLPPYIT